MSFSQVGYNLPTVLFGINLFDTIGSAGTDQFCTFFDTTNTALNDDENISIFAVPKGMTLHSFMITATAIQAVSVQNLFVRTGVSGAMSDTAITIEIPIGVGGQLSDLTHTAHINQGQSVSIVARSTVGGTQARINSIALLGDLDG